jgi:hypothetical protein
MSEYAVNGIIASVVSTSIFYPLDTLKSRKQAGLPLGSFGSLYKGIRPELLSCAPSAFVYWGTYKVSRDKKLTTTESAFVSCITSNVFDTYFDIRKKRNQLGDDLINKGNIYKYCFANVMSSVVYNLFYLNVLKKLKNDYGYSNTISIAGASSTSAFMSYWFDRYKTKIVYPNKVSYFKGLGYRLLHSNMYSGLYMSLFLWLNGDKIV